MADVPTARLQRRPALAGLALLDKPGLVRVTDPGPRTRMIFRGPARLLRLVLGFGGSDQPCRAADGQGRTVLWLGPDERLILAPDGETIAIRHAIETAAAGGPHFALVDVGHRQAAVEIEGPRAAWLLNAACPLDLELAAFPVGMCTRTVFGKAEIVLWRRTEATFHLEAWRSFWPYVLGLMAEAGRDLGAAPITKT